MGSVLQGDLGTSFFGPQRIRTGPLPPGQRSGHMPRALEHAVSCRRHRPDRGASWRCFSGLTAALYRNTGFTNGWSMRQTLTTISTPEFFVGLYPDPVPRLAVAGVSVACQHRRQHRARRTAVPCGAACHDADPLLIVAHMMRMTRAAIINLLASPYIEMARLKGARRDRRSFSSTRCPTPGPPSPRSLPSTLPIWWSASWWWKSFSSIPESGS